MENKAKKMFAAAAVIMLCAVAIVGVGYAYTASTENNNNNVTAEYITLTQIAKTADVEEGQYTFASNLKVDYDTVNTGPTTTTWKLTHGVYDTIKTGDTLVKIGNGFKIHGVATGADAVDITCFVDVSGITLGTGWKVFLKINNGVDPESFITYTTGSSFAESFTIKADTGTAYNDVVVEVYYGYTGSGGVTSQPEAKPFHDASLTFRAVKGLILDKSAVTWTESTDITASFSGITPASITWTPSSGITVVPSELNNTKCTISAVTTSGTITAKVTQDGVDYVVICTVTKSA